MFVANMSHEIRTAAQCHHRPVLPFDAHRTVIDPVGLVDRIKIASKSLLDIVNNVLDLSKLGAAALTLEQTPFCLRDAITELAQIVTVQVEERELTLRSRSTRIFQKR